MSNKTFDDQANASANHVMLETTAGEARARAPDAMVAEQVKHNVDRTHDVAEDAANVAKVKGPELTGEPISALEQLKAGASHATASAAAEGEKDVESVKAAGVSYIEQAKNLASSAIATAQSYLPPSLRGQTTSAVLSPHTKPPFRTNMQNSVPQSAISSAVATVNEYVDTAKGTAQGIVGTAGTHGAQLAKQKSVPLTSAPLESCHTTLEATYPGDANTKREVAVNEPRAT